MRGPQLFWFSGRMEGVPKRDHALQSIESLSGKVRRDSTTHRLSADKHPMPAANLPARVGDRLTKRRLEHGRLVGDAPPPPHVGEIKRRHVDASFHQAACDRDHEWMP